jgi:hypothetical protein
MASACVGSWLDICRLLSIMPTVGSVARENVMAETAQKASYRLQNN